MGQEEGRKGGNRGGNVWPGKMGGREGQGQVQSVARMVEQAAHGTRVSALRWVAFVLARGQLSLLI